MSTPDDLDLAAQQTTALLALDAADSSEALEQFYRDLPDLLNETMDHVTEAKVREFLEQTIDEATERVREYLR